MTQRSGVTGILCVYIQDILLCQFISHHQISPHATRFGHDFTHFPPTAIETGSRTFSWLYMPLIYDAVGLPWPPAWHFSRDELPPAWNQWVASYQQHFLANQWDSAFVLAHLDGPQHISGVLQNQMLDGLFVTMNEIAIYGNQMVQLAEAQNPGMGEGGSTGRGSPSIDNDDTASVADHGACSFSDATTPMMARGTLRCLASLGDIENADEWASENYPHATTRIEQCTRGVCVDDQETFVACSAFIETTVCEGLLQWAVAPGQFHDLIRFAREFITRFSDSTTLATSGSDMSELHDTVYDHITADQRESIEAMIPTLRGILLRRRRIASVVYPGPAEAPTVSGRGTPAAVAAIRGDVNVVDLASLAADDSDSPPSSPVSDAGTATAGVVPSGSLVTISRAGANFRTERNSQQLEVWESNELGRVDIHASPTLDLFGQPTVFSVNTGIVALPLVIDIAQTEAQHTCSIANQLYCMFGALGQCPPDTEAAIFGETRLVQMAIWPNLEFQLDNAIDFGAPSATVISCLSDSVGSWFQARPVTQIGQFQVVQWEPAVPVPITSTTTATATTTATSEEASGDTTTTSAVEGSGEEKQTSDGGSAEGSDGGSDGGNNSGSDNGSSDGSDDNGDGSGDDNGDGSGDGGDYGAVLNWNPNGNDRQFIPRDAVVFGFCVVRCLCSSPSSFAGVPAELLDVMQRDPQGLCLSYAYNARDDRFRRWPGDAYCFAQVAHRAFRVFSGQTLLRRAIVPPGAYNSPARMAAEAFRRRFPQTLSLLRWLNEGLRSIIPGAGGAVFTRRQDTFRYLVVGTLLGGRAGELIQAAAITPIRGGRGMREFAAALSTILNQWLYSDSTRAIYTIAPQLSGARSLMFDVPNHPGDSDGGYHWLRELGAWEQVNRRRSRHETAEVAPAADTLVAAALGEINTAIIGALYEIVRRGWLGRFVEWVCGNSVGTDRITFTLRSRASRGGDPANEVHSPPTASACFSTIYISDYRVWQDLYNHLVQVVLHMSRVLFGHA